MAEGTNIALRGSICVSGYDSSAQSPTSTKDQHPLKRVESDTTQMLWLKSSWNWRWEQSYVKGDIDKAWRIPDI